MKNLKDRYQKEKSAMYNIAVFSKDLDGETVINSCAIKGKLSLKPLRYKAGEISHTRVNDKGELITSIFGQIDKMKLTKGAKINTFDKVTRIQNRAIELGAKYRREEFITRCKEIYFSEKKHSRRVKKYGKSLTEYISRMEIETGF